jgi:hypothetical protein
MASLELVDHTQELQNWHLPQQQHGARQLAPAGAPAPEPAERPEPAVPDLTAE